METLKSLLLLVAGAAAVATLLTIYPSFTTVAAQGGDSGVAPELEGTWIIEVDLPQGKVLSLQTFARGGTFLESNSARAFLPAGQSTAGQGTWEKVDAHTYLVTFDFFFQPAGQTEVLRTHVRDLIEVDRSGETYQRLKSKRERYHLDGRIALDFPCEQGGGVARRVKPEEIPCP